jgi:hypothetical protein
LRPRVAGVNPDVVRETWDAVADGAHNSNTDLTFFDGCFYLCHQTSPYHMGSRRSRLLLWRSRDARTWEKVMEFKNETGREYRDPKFAVIRGRLFLYMLPNLTVRATPVGTVYTSSADAAWDAIAPIEPAGWLFWRPKTLDGVTWYVTAYWHDHGSRSCCAPPTASRGAGVAGVRGRGKRRNRFRLPGGRMLATARRGQGRHGGATPAPAR